jgi:hypothetical protein
MVLAYINSSPNRDLKNRDGQGVQKNRHSGRTLTGILENKSPERHDYTNLISAAKVESVNSTWTVPTELRCEDVLRKQMASLCVQVSTCVLTALKPRVLLSLNDGTWIKQFTCKKPQVLSQPDELCPYYVTSDMTVRMQVRLTTG